MAAVSLPLLHEPQDAGWCQISQHWCQIRDGDPAGLALFLRHYSCDRPARKLLGGNRARFTGPGGSLVLLSVDGKALFAWREERFRKDGQTGIQCAVFRNEGRVLSSDLIREASLLAWDKWPGARLYTYVSAVKIRSTNPGYCFLQAGWSRLPGRSKEHGLRVLECLP